MSDLKLNTTAVQAVSRFRRPVTDKRPRIVSPSDQQSQPSAESNPSYSRPKAAPSAEAIELKPQGVTKSSSRPEAYVDSVTVSIRPAQKKGASYAYDNVTFDPGREEYPASRSVGRDQPDRETSTEIVKADLSYHSSSLVIDKKTSRPSAKRELPKPTERPKASVSKNHPPSISQTIKLINKIGEQMLQSERNIHNNQLSKLIKQVQVTAQHPADSDSSTGTKSKLTKSKSMPEQAEPPKMTVERPTLASMARYHRQLRQVEICAELGDCVQRVGEWLEKLVATDKGAAAVMDDWPPMEVMKLVDLCMDSILKTSESMLNIWKTSAISFGSSDPRSIETKMNNFHDHLEFILEALTKLIVAVQRNREVRAFREAVTTPSGKVFSPLPFSSDKLVDIGMCFPSKYSSVDSITDSDNKTNTRRK